MTDATPPPIDEVDVARRLDLLRERVDVVRDRLAAAGGADVELLAVSKGHPVEAALAGARMGLSMLGENYAQELRAKAPLVAADTAVRSNEAESGPQWHFIGQLQTNKVKMIVDHVAVWQSVDRLKVGREIAKRAPGAQVFAQVNLSSEPQKAGCSFDDVDQLVADLRDLDLDVQGLMGVGSADDEVETAAGFRALRSRMEALGLAQCSMGMTADLELAVREGSTMVRVGSDLFGPRPG